MPRNNSLRGKKSFDTLFRKGTRRYSKYFTIVYIPSEMTKFGIIVQKKNVQLASHRNYTRRIIREILRLTYLPSQKTHAHIAILAKTDLKTVIANNGIDHVRNDMMKALQQIR